MTHNLVPVVLPREDNLRFCCPACGSSYFQTDDSGSLSRGICRGQLVSVGGFVDYVPCPARFEWIRTTEGDARVFVVDDGEWIP